MGKLSRNKGKVWEREVVRLLKPIFGDTVKRGLAQARFGASEEPDVKNVPRLWVECKHEKQVNVRAALRQAILAEQESAKGERVPSALKRWPVAICKDNQKKPGDGALTMAVLRLDDFLELLSEWWALTQCGASRDPEVTQCGASRDPEPNEPGKQG